MGQFRGLAGIVAKVGAAAQGVVTMFTATPALDTDDAARSLLVELGYSFSPP